MWFKRYKNQTISLDKAQRKFVASHLMNSGNAAVAGLVFTQVVLESSNGVLILVGMGIYIACWVVSVKLIRGTK